MEKAHNNKDLSMDAATSSSTIKYFVKMNLIEEQQIYKEPLVIARSVAL
jgi:hypothetical protein